MEGIVTGLIGSIGSVAVFGFLSFVVWINYRKDKDARETAHLERMKAMELGYPPADAEIQRAKAYSSAAWAAGLIGLLVPIVVISLAVAGTIVAVLHHEPSENIGGPLIAAWGIAALITLVTILKCLQVIHGLPRPTGDVPKREPPREKRADSASAEFQEKRLEL
jgi:hypothetical protein